MWARLPSGVLGSVLGRLQETEANLGYHRESVFSNLGRLGEPRDSVCLAVHPALGWISRITRRSNRQFLSVQRVLV